MAEEQANVQQAVNDDQQVVNQPLVTFATTAPEPQQQAQQAQTPDAYQAIIEQQQAQINALIAQTNAQSAQITQLVQSGGQFHAQPQQAAQQPQQLSQAVPQPQQVQFPNVYQPYDAQAAPNANWQPPSMLEQQDYSLESLGKEIGKHER